MGRRGGPELKTAGVSQQRSGRATKSRTLITASVCTIWQSPEPTGGILPGPSAAVYVLQDSERNEDDIKALYLRRRSGPSEAGGIRRPRLLWMQDMAALSAQYKGGDPLSVVLQRCGGRDRVPRE